MTANSAAPSGYQPLKMVIRCLVKKIHHKNNKAVSLETDRGDFTLGNAKLILAMGTLPPTTLMLNSFPNLSGIGTRFSAHFLTAVIARTPLKESKGPEGGEDRGRGKLEIGAVYIAGEEPTSKHQFHLQVTAVIDDSPKENLHDAFRHIPDPFAAPSIDQLLTSSGHTVFVCVGFGQIDHNNPQNWYRRSDSDNDDITCNATLQVIANDVDNAVWDTLDESTFKVVEDCLSCGGVVEYWNHETSCWQAERPPTSQIRIPGLAHESSTMWIGKSESDPVDQDYKFRGVENVYLTGGALWPTGASWNPTCAMTALAMDLADRLNSKA